VTPTSSPAFGDPGLHDALSRLSDDNLDRLDFGVIAFDAQHIVRRYNAYESKAAGLSTARVIGHDLFTVVAPCMNNYLVAQRFEDAAADGTALDDTIDYVLTLRMRPVKVRLRLLAAPGAPLRHVCVLRST
jgi:photoactive yellow protein